MKFIGGEDLSDQERERIADAEKRRRVMQRALKGRSALINELRRRRPADWSWEQAAEVAKKSAYDIAVYLVDLDDHEATLPRCQEPECTGAGQRPADGVHFGEVHNVFACIECATRAGVTLSPIPGDARKEA